MPGILRWGSNLFKDTKLDFISKVIDFGYFSSPYAALNQIKQNMVDAPSKKNREMFINQMFEKDGYTFKSKDQFVADSFNAYKQNTSQLGINIDRTAKFRNSPWDLLRLTAPGAIISGIESVFSTESGDIKKYLGNVYDDMKKTYITEYNSGRLASYNQGTHQYAQAMEAMVDGADFQNPVFHDYVSIMQNFNTVANEEGVKVLKGSNWTQKNFGDAETNTQSRMLMDYLNTDMINTTFKFDDRDRPMVRMINQGIAANDPNMTAYTFQVNDSYILANAGTDKKPGALSGLVSDGKVKKDANTFTVFIPKPLANNSYVYNLENGPYQTLLNETGSVNYSMSDVLDINVKKQGAQTKTTLNWKHFNINTGKWDIHSEERPYNDGSNLDEWLSSFKYDKKLGPIVKGIRDANIYNQIAYKQRNM
jgi:hypothetical protein